MAKKISSSDLFEQEDLFKGVRDSATKTLAVFNELQNELKATAQGLKSELANNTNASTQQMKQFTQATEEANKIMKQSVEIEKLKAQADQQKIKAEAELIKLEKLKAQETAKQLKEQEKAAKLAQNEASAYAKLSKQLNEARKAYKDLAVSNQENTQEGQDLLKTITALDKKLKDVDATVGQHQRNVGNYGEAAKSLKLELREITETLQRMETTDPRFQEMTQQAAELRDAIDDTNATIRATAGNAVENLSGAFVQTAQLGVAGFQGVEASMALFGVESENVQKSLMRLTALMNLSDSLKTLGELDQKFVEVRASITAFGSKALGAFKALTTAGKAFAVTGIGLIIAGLGLLIANWDKLTGKEKFNYDEFKKNQEKKIALLEKERELLDRNYKTISESSDQAVKGIDLEIQKAELQGKSTEELYKRRAKLIQQTSEQSIKATEKERQQIKDRVAQLELVDKGLLNNHAYYLQQKSKMDNDEIKNEFNKKQTARFLANYEERQALIARAYELKAFRESEFTKAEDAEDQLVLMKLKKQKEANDKAKQKRQEDLNALKGYIKEAQKVYSDSTKSETEQELAEIEEKYKERLALAKKYGKGEKEIEIAKMNEINAVHLRKINEQIEAEMKAREEARLNRIRLENEMLDELEQITEEAYRITLSDKEKEQRDLDEWYFNAKEKFKDNQEALYNIETIYLNKRNDINLRYQDEQVTLIDKQKEAVKKGFEDSKKWAQSTTEFFTEQSNKRIEQIDKEIQASEKQAEVLRQLAADGNINAQQSLAEQERIIAESNRRKEREQKRQQRMELANTVYQTYAGYAANDPKSALANTIKDTSLLQAFIQSLPMFYDGTEDTGKGGGVDGKGGFHAVLHPHERVIPRSLNEQLGSLTNEQLTSLATEYQNGRLVKTDSAGSSLELALMVNELRDLKQVIKQKPETNIELGEITSAAMEIVKSTKQGNTVVYNRFKVRK